MKEDLDLLIKNGRIIDGTGAPWFKSNLGIKDGKIVYIGKREISASRVIDASNLFVAPGFVDIHSHGDFTIVNSPEVKTKVMQGVTCELNGNCGMSVAPLKGEALKWAESAYSMYGAKILWKTFREYFEVLQRKGISINVAQLVGHGTVRMCVMGFEPRKPSPEELEEMKKLVEEAMMDGCIGMSTGLVYPPGFYADTEEIIELCKVVAKYDGIYASHVRGDRETQIESAQEFIEIAEKAGISAQLSHIEAKFPKNDPSFQKWKLAMLEEARSRGVDVTADTHEVQWIGVKDIRALLPFPWRTKTAEELYEILKKDGNMREQIKKDMQLDPRDPRARGGPFGLTQQRAWHRVKVYKSNVNKELNGKTIEEIAKIRNKQSEDVLLDLFVEENGKGPSLLLNYIESDMSTTAKHPLVVVPITDLTASNPEDVEGEMFENSPEWLGAFPNAIRKYALEYRYVTLEECIRKMTSLPYRIMKIWDRGIIRPGFWADIVIFDKERIRCKSDLDRPKEYPEGIHYVIVNGEIVVENGEFTGKYPGKILSHQYF